MCVCTGTLSTGTLSMGTLVYYERTVREEDAASGYGYTGTL